MYLPIGRTETEASSLRHLFEPTLRLQGSLSKWISTFKGEKAKGATLFSSRFVREQGSRWLETYCKKIMEMTTDAARADPRSSIFMHDPTIG